MKRIKKGQNFRCGFYELSPHERLDAIKGAGFDETMFWWGTEYEDTDGSRFDLFDYAVKIGLGVNTCHFPTTNAHWLWYGEERGKDIVERFVDACKECGERQIKNLVMHLTYRLVTPEPNEHGFANFAKMLEAAEKYGVVIAIENTRFLNYNDLILQRFSSPNIGFCFDSGHANCYTPGQQPLEKYGHMLVTTHIHDNIGAIGDKPDQHHLMGEGNIDFDKVFARLKHFEVERINLESYCNSSSKYFGKLSCDEYLQLSYDTLTQQMKKSGLN